MRWAIVSARRVQQGGALFPRTLLPSHFLGPARPTPDAAWQALNKARQRMAEARKALALARQRYELALRDEQEC
jgi:hypothetical protein